MKSHFRLSMMLLTVCGPLSAQGGPEIQWPYYGGDPGNSRFSQVTDINARNVSDLKPAWEWKHWEAHLDAYGTTPGFFENTPLMIDGVLYVTTSV